MSLSIFVSHSFDHPDKLLGVELRLFIARCVDEKLPVIPVLLPGVDKLPEKLSFLSQLSPVRFDAKIDEEEPLSRLIWGITGRPPGHD